MILWWRRARRGAGPARLMRRNCRWQPQGGSGTLKAFRCETCGVTAYSKERRGPRDCKKGLDRAGL